MLRMHVLALVLVVGLVSSAQAQDFDPIEVRVTSLTETLYFFQGAGGNLLACTGPDGVLLVDADYTEMSEKTIAAVEGLGAGAPRWVIDTHWHYDHVGGNAALSDEGVTVIAHEFVREMMSEDRVIEFLETPVPASPEAALPVVTFNDRMTLHWGMEEVRAIHAPAAHTGGDAIIVFTGANVIHSGDIIFCCGYPFIEIGAGGSIGGVIAAVESMLAMSDDETRIVPGHGPLASREDLVRYHGMLRDFRDAIAAEIEAGRSLQEVVEGDATADLDAEFGAAMFPPAAFRELVYRSLTAD